MSPPGSHTAAGSAATDLSEVEGTVGASLDLVAAARKHVSFLRIVAESQWLHHKPVVAEAVRRYEDLWMPLISDLTEGSMQPLVLPPIDVQWVWYCHTLYPVDYRQYCESRFSKLIGKQIIFDVDNEEYAMVRCREIWIRIYPSEPFENELDSDSQNPEITNEFLLNQVMKQRYLCSKFSEPYMSETVYLIAAKRRYKGFLYLLKRFIDGSCSRLVPASDILLMWLTHQSYPTVYTIDMIDMVDMGKNVTEVWTNLSERKIEETRKLWESTFDEPYEKAGGTFFDNSVSLNYPLPIIWKVTATDVNTRYKSIVPRFLLEVCVFVRLTPKLSTTKELMNREFLRSRIVRCHRELKIDTPIRSFPFHCWEKALHLYCEFGTQGVVLEVRRNGGHCFGGSSLQHSIEILWNDLLRVSSLTLTKDVNQNLRIFASITPPVQASYLLKCVPDRVTDDSGAMISEVILRMNQYRPQEGRWLSRTVLDHKGRECFVVRIRVGGGFWRRRGETPSLVKWEDRIIEVREGSWSYVVGSIGIAPEKVVGTATPREPSEQWRAAWSFSTGDELMIHWQASTSISDIDFYLKNGAYPELCLKLLKGRKMQYRAKSRKGGCNGADNESEGQEGIEEEEEGFLTLVRCTEENPTGSGTALLNWKLLAVEVSPEEDAVFVLLLCMSILRSISEMRKEDVGCLLIRRRLKEARLGDRDWGSVVLHPASSPASISSPHLQPWHWNADAVMASDQRDHVSHPPTFNYSPAECGDGFYKRGIVS